MSTIPGQGPNKTKKSYRARFQKIKNEVLPPSKGGGLKERYYATHTSIEAVVRKKS